MLTTSINQTMASLPLAILEEIFGFVGSVRQQRVAMTLFGKDCWLMLPELEKSIKTLSICDQQDADALLQYTEAESEMGQRWGMMGDVFLARNVHHVFLRLENLQCLNLHHYGADSFLEFLSNYALLPNLKALSMEGSMGVTDDGLRRIAENGGEPRRQNFSSLTITFCRNTSYAGTIFLREQLPNLKLIRRQPEWLDGQFYTPFAADGAPTEVHTYWPDGTFTFSRNSQSAGFVCDLFPWDPDRFDFVGDKLQYNNFEFPVGWPEWFRFAYRPGVSLLRLDKELENPEDKNSVTPCVLVGQHMRGLRPPNIRDLMESVSGMLKIGQGKQFTHDGEVLPDDLPADGTQDCIMISKMKVHPLPHDSLLPPANLFDECKRTCESMATYGKDFLRQKEDDLQSALTANNL
ncbi:unnamed protein product [Cylindrotheca closterium]|uniref:Uncharacterized protein n=1 Tax=Cylindrotheca closterium TaxID=2856 RepID=A0AAD2FJQ3_9STRA|nr:unnamed protein product [Cylindrotheca closterium]